MKKHIRKATVLTLGVFCILLGILGLILPILNGILLLLIGMIVLSLEFKEIEELLDSKTSKHPKIEKIYKKAQGIVKRLFNVE